MCGSDMTVPTQPVPSSGRATSHVTQLVQFGVGTWRLPSWAEQGRSSAGRQTVTPHGENAINVGVALDRGPNPRRSGRHT
jgi:hypothetical protein